YRHIVDLLKGDVDVRVTALFGPQHGFRSDLQDNMIETPHATDCARGIPVYSLYSETREPTSKMLENIDVLVIDLQDVGTRVYTYVYTMANCMRAAKRHGIDVIVCDRPNPIGGLDIEGITLEPGCESFVGQYPVPTRHGMTIGELARLFNGQFGIGASVEVIALDGWQRSMYWNETGLPWVMPSPNMPTVDTALVYPGMCLLEGTELSEGRGTTRPFELAGAPHLDGHRLAADLAAMDLPGVRFRPVVFTPQFEKHTKRACGGVQFHVTNPTTFRPYLTGVAFLKACRDQAPAEFQWRTKAYEFVDKIPAIDLLAGNTALRDGIEAGASLDELAGRWPRDEGAFAEERAEFLMYSEG
ncbi:MAG: exo-beta-N-acetylmuramidase NamZ family protein, partial [Steroidobacteraceae bacterium]